MFSTQRQLHWLEEGFGSVLLGWIASIALFLAFTTFVTYRQYRGVGYESLSDEAVVARSLACGHGYTTQVGDPQAVDLLARRAVESGAPAPTYVSTSRMPELYHPPGYATLLAGVYSAGGERGRAWFLDIPPVTGSPVYNAEWAFWGVSLVGLWASGFLAYSLASSMHASRIAGVMAAFGVATGVALVDTVCRGTGASLVATGALALLHCVLWMERQVDSSAPKAWAICLAAAFGGACAGLMHLIEYTAGIAVLAFMAYAIISQRGWLRWVAPLLALLAFVLVCMPWWVRCVGLSGSPVGLAWQDLYWKLGDTNALPDDFRSSPGTLSVFSGGAKAFVDKVMNKGLKGVEVLFAERIWSGGAGVFAAFALCGLFYRFRSRPANTVRWAAVGLFLSLAIGQAFMDSGDSLRMAHVYGAPLLVVAGVGFLASMVQARAQSRPWMAIGIWACVLLVQVVPMLQKLSSPAIPQPVSYPPYHPPRLRMIRAWVGGNLRPDYTVMSDMPGGFAWHGNTWVWRRPSIYSDFSVRLNTEHKIGALHLSPMTLNLAYYGPNGLLHQAANEMDEMGRNQSPFSIAGWSAVYASIPKAGVSVQNDFTGTMPWFFPMRAVLPTSPSGWSEEYILVNEEAMVQPKARPKSPQP